MLRRNRFGFRMRRRSFSNRLLQVLVVLSVLILFVYFLLYALRLGNDSLGPDYSWLKTRNMSHFILPEEDTTILEPRVNQCSATEKLRLVMFIHSVPGHFQARRVIRKTWLKEMLGYPGVKGYFLLGLAESEKEQIDIVKEHGLHDDIVQHNFIDTYVNLTLKTTFMLKWLTSNDCHQSKFVMKLDEDSFINPAKMWDSLEHALLHTATAKSLINYLPPTAKTTTTNNKNSNQPDNAKEHFIAESVDYLLLGHVFQTVPIRDPANRWYLPSRFYPLNIFPKFLSGTGYVFSNSISQMLYQCALKSPFINLEDVFLTGLCATTQMGFKFTHHPGFWPSKPSIGPNYVCYYKTFPLVHSLMPDEMEEMWVKIKDDHNCETFYFAFVQYATSFVDLFRNLFRL